MEQQANTSQAEQSICLYNKANMNFWFLGMRECRLSELDTR